MIEGVSVGLGSTGIGYNSVDYDYTLFEILETDPNIGGTLGTVRYNLSNIIADGEIPGTFQSNLSSPYTHKRRASKRPSWTTQLVVV